MRNSLAGVLCGFWARGLFVASLSAALHAGLSDFVRGDCNQDGVISGADQQAIGCVAFSDCETDCPDSCDADDSGALNTTDIVYLGNYLFRGGPQPPSPFPSCGPDGTSDSLECLSFNGC